MWCMYKGPCFVICLGMYLVHPVHFSVLDKCIYLVVVTEQKNKSLFSRNAVILSCFIKQVKPVR